VSPRSAIFNLPTGMKLRSEKFGGNIVDGTPMSTERDKWHVLELGHNSLLERNGWHTHPTRDDHV
jgi:hypothetical protein